eukprot:13391-Heterococcus_DN1.PRE.4
MYTVLQVASYKKSLASIRRDYQSALENDERQGLMSTTDGQGHLYAQAAASREHRDRLLKTNDRLDAQSEMLANSKRMVLEIEDVAGEISTELGRNRETILAAHGKVSQPFYEFCTLTLTACRILLKKEAVVFGSSCQ